MHVDIYSAVLSYATIPIYFGGLLLLVYIVARSQLGFSLSRQIKASMKADLERERPQASASSYVIVLVMFALCIALAAVMQKRR